MHAGAALGSDGGFACAVCAAGTCVFQDTVTKACKFKEWDYNMIQPMVVLLEGSTVLSVWNWKCVPPSKACPSMRCDASAQAEPSGVHPIAVAWPC